MVLCRAVSAAPPSQIQRYRAFQKLAPYLRGFRCNLPTLVIGRRLLHYLLVGQSQAVQVREGFTHRDLPPIPHTAFHIAKPRLSRYLPG